MHEHVHNTYIRAHICAYGADDWMLVTKMRRKAKLRLSGKKCKLMLKNASMDCPKGEHNECVFFF